jgi:hypothetical protein
LSRDFNIQLDMPAKASTAIKNGRCQGSEK